MIPGMVSATFREKPVERILELCGQAGLKGVEWSENAHVLPNDYQQAEKLYDLTSRKGIAIAAYGSYYKLGQQSNAEENFSRSLISAKGIRAPIIRVWAGTKASDIVIAEERIELTREAALIAQMAEAESIKIALEWHKDTLTDTNESALQLLNEVKHPNLYCLWQPTVALNEEQRCEGIRLLGDRLLNFHVYYWEEGKRRPFFEGISYWREYLRHIPQDGRFGLLEFVKDNTEQQFLQDAASLIRLLEEINQ